MATSGRRPGALRVRVFGCRVPPASWFWRAMLPCAALRQRGHAVRLVDSIDPRAWHPGTASADVVVLQRFVFPAAALPDARVCIAAWRAAGAVVIGDYDDHLWIPDAAVEERFVRFRVTRAGWLPLGPARVGREVLPAADRLAKLQLFDAVTVSTPALAAVVRGLTDAPVAVVPNLLDLAWWGAVQDEHPRLVPPLTVGWAGSVRPAADLAPMLAAWARLARRYPHLRFVTAGDPLPEFAAVAPAGRWVHHPRAPLADYPLAHKSIDIGCADGADNAFSRCRSPIKALEYGATGAAVVASPVVYGDLVRDGETGLLATTTDEWEAAIARLVEDAALRGRLAAALTAVVERDWSLERHAGRWLAAWAGLREAALARRAAPAGIAEQLRLMRERAQQAAPKR